MKMNNNGKLFVLEGPDGSGKSTLCKKISNQLIHEGFYSEVVVLPNPDCFGYSKIRELLTKNTNTDILQTLMIVNMKETFDNMIKPRIEHGINIILDRWLTSTIIYNILNDGNLTDSMSTQKDDKKYLYLDEISSKYCGLCLYPDKIFYLSLPKSIVMKHANDRNSKELNDKDENVKKIYNLYNDFYTSLNRETLFPFISKKYLVSEYNSDNRNRYIIIRSDFNDNIDETIIYNDIQKKIISEIYSILK